MNFFPNTPKICNFQPCANKRTYLMKTIKYKDDKKDFQIPQALRNKTVPRLTRLVLVLNGYGCLKYNT